MKRISVGFSKSKSKFGIFSWLIRKWYNIDYSHTYIRFHKNGEDLIHQASGLKVNVTNNTKFNENSSIIKEFIFYVDDFSYNNIEEYCIKQIGTGYSFSQVISIFIQKFLPKFKGFGGKGFICTEFVMRSLLISSKVKPYILGYNLDHISPSQVFEITKKLHEKIKYL